MSPADELLERIDTLWAQTRTQYRDRMLRIGKMLHEYVLLRLKEGDLLGCVERARKGITRSCIVETLASRLNTGAPKINEVIRAAMGVELLSKDGNIGDLSYSCFRYLYLIIERKYIPREQIHRRVGNVTPGAIPPSSREQWRIRPGMEQKARALFAKAVEGSWKASKFLEEFRSLRHPEKRKCYDWASFGSSDHFDWLRAARESSPRDVAEMITKMIEQSKSPDMVTRILLNVLLGKQSKEVA